MERCESDLPAQEDDPGVGVVEGQQDAAAGVQLLQRQRLTEVLLPGDTVSQTDSESVRQEMGAFDLMVFRDHTPLSTDSRVEKDPMLQYRHGSSCLRPCLNSGSAVLEGCLRHTANQRLPHPKLTRSAPPGG